MATKTKTKVDPKMVGRFQAKVIDHTIGRASTGTIQCGIQFAFKDEDDNPRTLWDYLPITEDALSGQWGTTHRLRNLGWDPVENGGNFKELGRKSEFNEEGGVLMGTDCSITTEIDKYRGDEKLRIAWINEAGGGGMKDDASRDEDDLTEVCDEANAILSGMGLDSGASVERQPRDRKERTSRKSGGSKPKGDYPF